MSFLDVLAQNNVLTPEQVASVTEERDTSGKPLDSILRERGVDKQKLLEAKSTYYNLPFRNVSSNDIPFDILKYIPEESVQHYRFVPIAVTDGVLEVGIADPDNLEVQDALQFISSKINLPFKMFVITEEDFEQVVKSYKGLSGQVTQALSDLEGELSTEERELSHNIKNADKAPETEIVEEAPVTKIVANILRYAIEGHASDIHVEPMGEKLRVRFRVDGVLNTSLVLPTKVQSAVVARVKILSKLKLDEKRKPQDGRFSAHIEGRKIDFRVSTFPTYYGEKVVIRILDSEKGVIALDKMGLSDRNLKSIRNAIARPYGMILISGPTGSGKTTTLYSMLNEVDREGKNVLSLEDPVEYNVPGISQSQVRPEIGYTFASGLRTTLRQDPDIIMVGEIRDKETASLAVQAALTGHLVLSTIHTNNAVGVVPRLIDMGVDPYLIAPTLVLAIAQRLVRKLCPGTGKPLSVEGSLKEMLDRQFATLPAEYSNLIPTGDTMYAAEPTPECPSGTRGRAAVFEILDMDRNIEQVILENPTELALMDAARKGGMLTMKEDALTKALVGIVPFGEVNALGGIYDGDEEASGETI